MIVGVEKSDPHPQRNGREMQKKTEGGGMKGENRWRQGEGWRGGLLWGWMERFLPCHAAALGQVDVWFSDS